MTFEDSEKNLLRLERALSSDRLKPYLIRARGDLWVAIQLYRRNTEISEALYGVLQGSEVFLRNATHEILSKAFLTDEWWKHTSLRDRESNDLQDAIKSISDRGVFLTPGRIVAELNLGFWTNLYSNFYEHDLWVPHLRKLFPIKIQRKMLHDRMSQFKILMNRVAHHETLIRRNVKKDDEELIETIGWMSPTVRSWIETTSCFEERFTKRILRRVVASSEVTL